MGQLRPEIKKETPERLVGLMKRCWDHEPRNRPEMAEVVEKLEEMKQEIVNFQPRVS